MDIKPIETVYNGYRFRSRLEARWAVFFDALKIKYQYEPEGYDLGGAGLYLPDFWLPGSMFYIEIKGVYPSKIEIEKCEALHHLSTYPVLALIGPPWDHDTYLFCTDTDDGGGGTYSIFLNTGTNYLSINSNGDLCVITGDSKTGRVFHNSNFTKAKCIFSDYTIDSFSPYPLVGATPEDVIRAMAKRSKQARFEHGENGFQ